MKEIKDKIIGLIEMVEIEGTSEIDKMMEE